MTTGETTAIAARIARDHGQSLRRFVASRLRQAVDQIDDVCQEVYLRLLRRRELDSIENPEAYLIQVANHTLHDLNYGRTPRIPNFAPESSAMTAPDPAEAADVEGQLRWLDHILSTLPPRVHASFLMYRVEGLSHGQIAARLGMHPNTVKNDIKAAVSHISQHFGKDRA